VSDTGRSDVEPGEEVPSGLAALDALLAERRLLVVAGPGGVGKTTTAAALGVRAAREHGRRVTVVTVDPARRLADALGVSRLTEEPVLVPVGGAADGANGRLWVVMVDMAKSWDRLVAACAPDPSTGEQLLANGLYRSLTRRFVQSHDYIALDQILRLEATNRSDLLIVDTPPSSHALDLLDAPGRLREFFDSRLLRLLTAGRGGLGQLATRPFDLVARRLLGDAFLADIVEFFTLFGELRPAMADRIDAVTRRLDDPSTVTVAVSTPEPAVAASTEELLSRLGERGREPEVLIVNRVPPPLSLDDLQGHATEQAVTVQPTDYEDPSLRQAVEVLLARARSARLPEVKGAEVVGIALQQRDPVDVDALAELLRPPGSTPG
jgi:anion-transporting  ArsA/GET3 family ATPase